jgi:hypothetical protein
MVVATTWPKARAIHNRRALRFAPAVVRAGAFQVGSLVGWTTLGEQFDTRRQLLADVEALRALTEVPIEAIPIRPMARSGW